MVGHTISCDIRTVCQNISHMQWDIQPYKSQPHRETSCLRFGKVLIPITKITYSLYMAMYGCMWWVWIRDPQVEVLDKGPCSTYGRMWGVSLRWWWPFKDPKSI